MTISAVRNFEREVKPLYEGGRSRKNIIKCQIDGYRFLAAMIIEQSKEDLTGDNPLAAVDSLAWWLDGSGAEMAEALGVYKSDGDIMSWIAGGCGNG